MSRWLKLPRSATSSRLARLLVGAGLMAVVVQWAHALTAFGGPSVDDVFGRWVYDGIGVLAALACLAAGRASGDGRRAWLVLGLGLSAKSVGDLVYSTAANAADVPVPSWSDPLWLAFYPAAFLSLVRIARARTAAALSTTRLDGVICGVTAASVLACVSLPAAVSSNAGSPFWAQVTSLAYPAGDLILVGVVVSVVALTGWRPDRTLVVLGMATLAWVAADVIYLFPNGPMLGDVADALVLTGITGMALAAVIDRPARRAHHREHGALVPVAFGGVALIVLVLGAVLRIPFVGLALAALALALVLGRMATALAENRALLGQSRIEASTDPLTGLGNRRKLKTDLARRLDSLGGSLVLILLDLNGFKAYNDTFGHAAGDTLLGRFGAGLARAVRGIGEAYRLGGDEFCVLAQGDEVSALALAHRCADALSAHGEGFSITAAHGCVVMPDDACDAAEALALADTRMYANKATAGRPLAAAEHARVLVAVLEERAPDLAEHSKSVRALSLATGQRLGLGAGELEALGHAASLHDIGKLAIPDSVLLKAGPLRPSDWSLIHQHTIIGQRIMATAPALSGAAQVVRSSHERVDGAGYPDGLAGEEIPIAARIIAVADAFGAMTRARPYRPACSPDQALAELHRCAGSQFDVRVVHAFAAVLAGDAVAAAPLARG